MLHHCVRDSTKELFLVLAEHVSDNLIDDEQRADVDSFLSCERCARVEFEMWRSLDKWKSIESLILGKICNREAGAASQNGGWQFNGLFAQSS